MYSLLTEPSVPVLLGYTFLFGIAWSAGKTVITAALVLLENAREKRRIARIMAAVQSTRTAEDMEREAVPAPLKKTRGARV